MATYKRRKGSGTGSKAKSRGRKVVASRKRGMRRKVRRPR